MKIKIGDKVYLQKIDVAFILHELSVVPASFMDETLGRGTFGCFTMDSHIDGFEFVCIYEDPKTVDWLMEQDWIVNYEDYSETPIEELKALKERLVTEGNAKIDEFNARDEEFKKANFEEKNDEFTKLGHKIDSLIAFIGFRKGNLKFGFPKDYQNESTDSDSSDTTSTSEKKPSFFERLFSHGAQ